MTRPYRQKRRAEQQADTRRRIVEATIDLHSSVGPAQTTVSMVAERAGVQRHTVYAHFPDEFGLFLACSALAEERDPLPDGAPWASIGDRRERLRTGLRAIYGWYGRNAGLAACVWRDAEVHKITQDIVRLRYAPSAKVHRQVLGAQLTMRQRALLEVALSYYTWRTLVRDAGLSAEVAVETMVATVYPGPKAA